MLVHAVPPSLDRLARLALASCLASACTPSMNWREISIEGTSVTALLPCKPSVYARQVQLDGQVVPMTLQACSTGGSTWAIAHARVADPAAIAPALAALLRASASNIGRADPTVEPWAPPGATPQPTAGRVQERGKRPDGRETSTRSAAFATGLVIVQASVVGAQLAEEDASAFFAGLRVRP